MEMMLAVRWDKMLAGRWELSSGISSVYLLYMLLKVQS